MKALLTGLLMAGTFLSSTQAAPALSVPTTRAINVAPNLVIKIEVTFGRASKGCQGFGICKATITIGLLSTNMGMATAEMLPSGKLQMAFDGSSMDATTKRAFFSGSTFKVEEDYQITGAEAAALGVRSYTIATGSYPITVSGSNYIVVF